MHNSTIVPRRNTSKNNGKSNNKNNDHVDDSKRKRHLQELMRRNYAYPSTNDAEFQDKIYTKREFQVHRMLPRDEIKTDNDIKDYRENICGRAQLALLEQQEFLGNFINPDTPYMGLIAFHGTGTGKTCAAISICERFKTMVQKYNTKIYILVPGPIVKTTWKNEILKCTGETYLKLSDLNALTDENEKNKLRKLALNSALQYYRIITHRSFYRKVLGEKIIEKHKDGDHKERKAYRKTEEGEVMRDVPIDRINNLNNTILVVDEAHSLTGNEYGEALKAIKRKSFNLRIIALSATPMKNLADDIVELLNYVRPVSSPVLREKIFTSDRGHEMKIRPGGLDYLKKMANGYVSYLRGADPLVFAERVDMGEVPKGLLFTKVIRCKMEPFQLKTYLLENARRDDTLEKRAESVANIVFPCLSEDKKSLTGCFGKDGINRIRDQLKTESELLNKRIGTLLHDDEIQSNSSALGEYLRMNDGGKNLSGRIFAQKNIKTFSTKFYYALKNLEKLVYGNKGAGTAFVYSYLVKVGIEIFREILLQNGYLEFVEPPGTYVLSQDTKCYFCGKSNKLHLTHQLGNIPEHEFRPAVFVTITGKTGEEGADIIPEEKQRILNNIFNTVENKDGKIIKFILGSRVMNESVSMANIREVHMLDVHFNLGRVDQAVGRAIRRCSHYKLISEKNKFPKVEIYKYVIALDGQLSTEELLYKNAEIKHLLIKLIERALKEVAVDCPLNMSQNIFKQDLVKYKNCSKKGHERCPAICDYMECAYKCFSRTLNAKYYDPSRSIYRAIEKNKIDYSTFTHNLARGEIDISKQKIKELFRRKHVYKLIEILKYVKNTYPAGKRDLFDEFFVYKALDEMIPLTSNDFNNFRDTIIDRLGKQGYLIYRGNYYIFQPFDQNEDVPMYYRSHYDKHLFTAVSLNNYVKDLQEDTKVQESKTEVTHDTGIYDFESTREYYDSRDEFPYVGIIDKELSRHKHKRQEELTDVFKIRNKRGKILAKKRGIGIPTMKGAVCTTRDINYLTNVLKKLDMTDNSKSRVTICDRLMEQLLYLEKYSTAKDKNKMTYVIIPANHSKYPFPYNLEDRVEYIKLKIKNSIRANITFKVDIKKDKGKEAKYYISFPHTKQLESYIDLLKKNGAKRVGSKWQIVVE